MSLIGSVLFKFKVRNSSKVKRVLEKYDIAIASIFSKNRLQKLLLKRTKDRFLPPGTNPRAQKDPKGKTWEKLSPNTKRKINRNRSQVLVETSALWKSIQVVKQRMQGSVLQSPTGGGFSIGIRPNDPANNYARLHQFGGFVGKSRIPVRRFLGISKEDTLAVDNGVKRLLKKHGIGVS